MRNSLACQGMGDGTRKGEQNATSYIHIQMKSADKDTASHKSSGLGGGGGEHPVASLLLLPHPTACGSTRLLLLLLLLLSLSLLLPKQDIICSRQNFINARLAFLPASQQQTAVRTVGQMAKILGHFSHEL